MSTVASKDGDDARSSAEKSEAASTAASTQPSGTNKSSSDLHVSLAFPVNSLSVDPSPHLAPLSEENSAYALVAKACLHINQYAGHGSSVTVEDNTSVASATLLHDHTYSKNMSAIFSALYECIQSHKDRCCRILACKTLALVARAAYARIRHSPLLFSLRESNVTRLEDEVSTDVPVALCTAALNDLDDGVSASAVHALGMMTLSISSMPGTLVEDCLWKETQAIAFAHVSPYCPKLPTIDEDPNVAQYELQTRIYENVMSSRLWRLVTRVCHYNQADHHRLALPFLAECLVHSLHTTPAVRFGMDRSNYAKRWVELDAPGLVQEVVHTLILPCLQSNLDGDLAHAAALSGLRLASASPNALWVSEVCQWAVVVLTEELSATRCLEMKMAGLAALLIALRAIPLRERLDNLQWTLDEVTQLPATTMAPFGITSPGMVLEYSGQKSYRRPARIGFLTELALSCFRDGPVEHDLNPKSKAGGVRSQVLKEFLSSPSFKKAVKGAGRGTLVHIGDELLLAFCSVAASVGCWIRGEGAAAAEASPLPEAPGTKRLEAPVMELEEWIRMAYGILKVFHVCTSWGPAQTFLDDQFSVLIAGQAAYVRLVQDVLHTVGLLNPLSSVAIVLTPRACSNHLIWDSLRDTSERLLTKQLKVVAVSESLLGDIAALMEGFVQNDLQRNYASHHIRMLLLTMGVDQWVQGRFEAMRREFEAATGSNDGSSLTLRIASARELLTALSPRRVLAKLAETNKGQSDAQKKQVKKEKYKRFAQETLRVCVACIENIALTACDWRHRFGGSVESKHLVALCVATLQGKSLTDNSADPPSTPVFPMCQVAIDRIQVVYEQGGTNGLEIDGKPVSPLLQGAGEAKKRALVTGLQPVLDGREGYLRGHFMALSQQIVQGRIDQALLSSPPYGSLPTSARAQNWLRLATPPLPPLRKSPPTRLAASRLAWGETVSSLVGASDPMALTLAYTHSRILRYDGEDEFRLTAVMRVHNTTAVEISQGIRLDLGLVHQGAAAFDVDDSTSVAIAKALGTPPYKTFQACLASTTADYKHELKAGDHLTWVVTFRSIPQTGKLALCPAVTFRSLEVEPIAAKWVGIAEGEEGGLPETDEPAEDEEGETENVTLPGEPMPLSSLVGLQPCPLVFFRDCNGDVNCFRFFWFCFQHQIPPIKLVKSDTEGPISKDARSLATMSSVRFTGEEGPGGTVNRLWAFMSLEGKRIFCITTHSVEEGGESSDSLFIRGDDPSLLLAITGSQPTRTSLVSALVPGMHPAYES